jgi:predicted nucleic acid-binding protein
MPAARVFVDSNTFLYTFDEFETEKGRVAQNWLIALADHGQGVTNLQALNEVASVSTRKRSRFGGDDPFVRIDAFSIFGSSPVTLATSVSARRYFSEFHYSWWDCLLLVSALELGCTHFLSEDLQDGQVIDTLTIVDPFAHSPEQILISR